MTIFKCLMPRPRWACWVTLTAVVVGLCACQRLPQAKGGSSGSSGSSASVKSPPARPFTVGIYGVPGVADLEAVHQAGFSLVMGGLDPAYMDAAARLGLGVIASPGSSAGSAFDEALVRRTVRRWDRHPALAGWYLIDEPDLNEVPAEQVELARDTVKSAGAQKPTALVVARGWNLAKFHTADVLMVDFYPVGWIPVPAFFQHMRHGATAARVGGKQFYAVIQSMDWGAYQSVEPFPPPFSPRPPTEAELRSMTWGARLLGADGVVYYPYRDGSWEMPRHPETWKALTHVVQEVRRWEPIFAAPATSKRPPRSEMMTDRRNEALEPPVLWSVSAVERGNGFVKPGEYWVLVNTTERLQQIRVTDAAWWTVRLPDVRTGEDTAVDDDGWMPALEPFEVRILGPIPRR
ncbi:MAG: hypothetical protein RLZZ34_761 [Verrucomicrobiota bacterium]